MRACPRCREPTEAVVCEEHGCPTVEMALPGSAHAEDPLLGAVLQNRYLVEELLGCGGFANVYLARHVQTGGKVAVKVLHPSMLANEAAVRRFRVEAENTCKLQSQHTVRISDFGRRPDGSSYLVMEFIEGRPLTKILEAEGHISPARTVRVVDQVLRSLAEAHSKGVVHRDIKPENIMLANQFGEPDFAKVLDFGISRFLAGSGVGTFGALGTPKYMSPEQCRGLKADHRADLYSVGVVAFEMLSGRLPFESEADGKEKLVAFMAAHIKETPPRVRDLAPQSVPAALDDLVANLLAKDPEDRPNDAEVVLTSLAQVRAEIRTGVVKEPEAEAAGRAGGSVTREGSRPLPERPTQDGEQADDTGGDAAGQHAAPRRFAGWLGTVNTFVEALRARPAVVLPLLLACSVAVGGAIALALVLMR